LDDVKLSWRRQALPLRHRFATARGGIERKETVVVELEHDGLVGRGEATPSALYGETLASCESAVQQMAGEMRGSPWELERLTTELLGRHDGQRAAVAAVDSALHDWVARKLGEPLWRVLGLSCPAAKTTFTIGLAEPEEVRVKVREALAEGYEILKVKVGGPEDEGILAIIREQFDGPLWIDANEAWPVGRAATQLRSLRRFRPALVEQPLARDDWPALRDLRELGVAPIYADESCTCAADVVRLRECVDGVNVKLAKCGGVREAMRMIHVARALGLHVMLGCFVSSTLAIAPALALTQLVDAVDLDGHLLLAADPFEGIERSGSVLSLRGGPGLGVVAREAFEGDRA
jgi:L-alanine-DL-glutamate epimerase-like enolase superfamily enzyme